MNRGNKKPYNHLQKMQYCVYAFLLFSLLSSCAKKNEPNTQVTAEFVHTIPTASMEEGKALVAQGKIKCLNTIDCNESVAMISIVKNNSLSLCTSFLIDNDILVTNSHCIPQEIKNGSIECKDRISARFAASANHEEDLISCESLLHASDLPTPYSSDFAFLRMQKTNRKPLAVNPSGLRDDAILRLVKITPTNLKTAEGVMQIENCKVIQNSYLLPSFKHKFNASATLADCNIQAGNSGSPLLNSQGEALAIAQAYAKMETNPTAQKILKKYANTNSFPPMIFASNFSCIPLPERENLSVPQQCQATNKLTEQSFIEENITSELEHLAQQQAQLWILNHSDMVKWENVKHLSNNYSLNYSIVPTCLVNPKSWPRKEDGNIATYQGLPVNTFSIQFNRYLQSNVVREQKTMNIRLLVEEKNDLPQYVVSLFREQEDTAFHESVLGICSNDIL